MMTEVLSDSASGTESLKCGRVSDSSSGDALENGASGVNGSDPGRVYSGRDTINISLPDMYHVLPIYLKKNNVSDQLIVIRNCLFALESEGIKFIEFR